MKYLTIAKGRTTTTFKRASVLLLAIGILSTFLALPSYASSVITFNKLTPTSPIDPCFGPESSCIPSLNTDGFQFTSPDNGYSNHAHLVSSPYFLSYPGVTQLYPSNGTQYIGMDTSYMGMTRLGGGTFSLSSLDAAEGIIVNGERIHWAATLQVEGNLAGGGIVNKTFVFDGNNDGPGGSADFQTFTLPGTFSNLTSVTFTGFGATGTGYGIFSIDNLSVTVDPPALPEPATMLLLGIGLMGLAGVRRKLN